MDLRDDKVDSDPSAVRRAKGIRIETEYSKPPHDSYYTPPEAVLALLEFEHFKNPVWEPACGDGSISKVLKVAGYEVLSSDLRPDTGYGIGGVDFLKAKRNVPSIITNPPFSLAQEFVEHAIKRAQKVAILARLQFLEGKRRHKLFSKNPPAKVYVFSKRISCAPMNSEVRRSIMAFAWFVWDQESRTSTQLHWLAPSSIERLRRSWGKHDLDDAET